MKTSASYCVFDLSLIRPVAVEEQGSQKNAPIISNLGGPDVSCFRQKGRERLPLLVQADELQKY